MTAVPKLVRYVDRLWEPQADAGRALSILDEISSSGASAGGKPLLYLRSKRPSRFLESPRRSIPCVKPQTRGSFGPLRTDGCNSQRTAWGVKTEMYPW